MKRLPLILGIVFTVVILVLAGVFVYQSMISAPRAAEKNAAMQKYSIPSYEGSQAGKPKASFSGTDQKSQDVDTLLQQVDTATSAADTDLQTLQTEVDKL